MSDCYSSDSRPNSNGSSSTIRVGNPHKSSRDLDSDDGMNDDYESESECTKEGSSRLSVRPSSSSPLPSANPNTHLNGTHHHHSSSHLGRAKPDGPASGSTNSNNNNNTSTSNLNGSSGSSTGGGSGSKRKKKTRTVFSRSQVFQLESTFDVKRYLSSSERAGLAASLHLTETQVRLHSFPRTHTPYPSRGSTNKQKVQPFPTHMSTRLHL